MKLHFLHNLIARKYPKFYFQFLSLFIYIFCFALQRRANKCVRFATDITGTSGGWMETHFFRHAFNREILQVLNELLSKLFLHDLTLFIGEWHVLSATEPHPIYTSTTGVCLLATDSAFDRGTRIETNEKWEIFANWENLLEQTFPISRMHISAFVINFNL